MLPRPPWVRELPTEQIASLGDPWMERRQPPNPAPAAAAPDYLHRATARENDLVLSGFVWWEPSGQVGEL